MTLKKAVQDNIAFPCIGICIKKLDDKIHMRHYLIPQKTTAKKIQGLEKSMNKKIAFTKVLITFFAVTFLASAENGAHECFARKSILIMNPTTGDFFVRKAQSVVFQVSGEEHSNEETYDLIENSGEKWGKVKIMTGTLTREDTSKASTVTAWIENTDLKIIAYLNLTIDSLAIKASTVTIIDEANTDQDPNLSLECILKK